MNQHDIVAFGWNWERSNIPTRSEPIFWRKARLSDLNKVEDTLIGDNDAKERVFLKLRNGQTIRVKLKEQNA